MHRAATAAFWTLCVWAYGLALGCVVALLTGVQWLPFDNAGYMVYAGWTKDALFTENLSLVASVALLPFGWIFRRSLGKVLLVSGIWCLHLFLNALPAW